MGIGLSQIKHVKLPVADLRRSASWYRALFDLELVAEYVEQGEVRGVSLLDRDGGFEIALRQRVYCAGQPRLAGFDVFALRSPTEELVTTIAERCDRLGIQHTEVWHYPEYGRAWIYRTRTERWSGSSGTTRTARPASSEWHSTPRGGQSRTASRGSIWAVNPGNRMLGVVRVEHVGSSSRLDAANTCIRGHAPASFDIGRASPRAGMYLFECEATFQAEPDAVWKAWTDVARWPEWDVSKEMARLDGPFEPGVGGWAKQRGKLGGSFTITAVDAGRRWVTECPVPLGKVVFDHLIEPVAGGRVRVVKSVEVEGGFGPLLRLFAPKMRRDIAESLAALGRRLSS